jgi:hypothetical protein
VKGCHVRGLPAESVRRHAWTEVGSIRGMLVGFFPAGCISI